LHIMNANDASESVSRKKGEDGEFAPNRVDSDSWFADRLSHPLLKLGARKPYQAI